MNIQKLKYKLYKGERRTQTIKKNILGSFAVKGVSILVSLALIPLTLGYVSSEIYGIWLIISSILHWLVYMDVGFTSKTGWQKLWQNKITKRDVASYPPRTTL